jgi:hypothetical protein
MGMKESLAPCEATPESNSFKRVCLILRWGGRGFLFNRFFVLRDTNRQDANSTSPLGTDTKRPPLNLFPDKFLDFGQVGVRFEFTPAGFVCWGESSVCPSTGKWQRHRSTESARHSYRATHPSGYTRHSTVGKYENQRILEMSAQAFIKPNGCLFMLRKQSMRSWR